MIALAQQFSPTGALVGLMAGLGAWLVVIRLPPLRRIDLDQRIGPYVRDVARPSALLARDDTLHPLTLAERILRPVLADATRWLERITGGPGTVNKRLEQAGRGTTPEQFRAQQVVWGFGGVLAGLMLALAIASQRGFAPAPLVALAIIGGLTGVLARDQMLTHAVRSREERILAEFPTVAELLALAIGAGEGPVSALERVARTARGELAGELRRTVADARAGATLVEALEGLARRSSVPILARFVDGVAIAVQRGTPLADVLRAQAQDVREAGRRNLIETGGRKEIAMMVPVVFLLLPITILFAIYPGLAALRLQLG